MPLTDFPWPPVPPAGIVPAWSGSAFQIGGQSVRVVAYDESDSHWSEELTNFHETAAGRHHPIDAASRRLAIASLMPLRGHPGVRILDAGCSSGFMVEELRRALPEAGLIATDYLRGPLEDLARRIEGVPLLQFDLRRCPLPGSIVDGIVCLNVLEHIDDDAGALRHLCRILQPGGIAHVEVPSGPGLYDIYDEHLMHHRRYRMRDLKRMARACGFTVEQSTHLGCLVYPAFWLVKKLHRRKLALPAAEKSRLVAAQIRATRRSFLFARLMQLETALGKFVSFPFGIRCIVVLRKRR